MSRPNEEKKAIALKKRGWTIARRIVQVCALVLFCLPVLVAGWGLLGLFEGGDVRVPTPAEGVFFGTLSSSTVAGVTLLDPFAVLQIAAASLSFDLKWLVGALPVLLVYGLIRGRAFCGWVCPVGLLSEGVDWLARRLKIERSCVPVPRRAKVGLAAAVLVLSAVTGVAAFEVINPISAINKGLVLGSSVGVWVLAAIVVVELLWAPRVWCRSLCPLGGFYEVLGRVGLVNVRIDHDACIDCGLCKKACPADPAILDAPVAGADCMVRAGDCMACGACVEACPTRALAMKLGRPGKPEAPASVGAADPERLASE